MKYVVVASDTAFGGKPGQLHLSISDNSLLDNSGDGVFLRAAGSVEFVFESATLVATVERNTASGNRRNGFEILSEGGNSVAVGGNVAVTLSDNIAVGNGTLGVSGAGYFAEARGGSVGGGGPGGNGRLDVRFEHDTSIGNIDGGVLLRNDAPVFGGNGEGVFRFGGGRNRIFGNGGSVPRDITADRATIVAGGNWWGASSGLAPGLKLELNGASIDSTNPLTADPGL